ncbi:DUF5929 domain-containing protein [Flavicella sediminum]|uniref:DUF5929 domain-containing protein n=1 Tax=Flavicella sediminum TaxID=2585141 RepID=UPI00111F2C79|nr:DUF5929 domain-containing protein [Flavicella sediminum]
MINKRLLIRNLLSHNDENSFFDKKLKIDLETREGKAKFLKHICALSNSNPLNNAYIVIGVDDVSDKIMGVDFFDDSRIQDLINACLVNPPSIRYENVSFPSLPRHKVVGLVTIHPINLITSLKKNYWKYNKGMVFFRKGSSSAPTNNGFVLKSTNEIIVSELEKNSSDNLELTLNGVFDFIQQHPKKYQPKFKVYKEYFVLCWAGQKKKVKNEIYYSRVDIELIKERVRLFYSALDDVQIQVNDDSFIITEYIYFGILSDYKYYPLEKTVIHFKENAKYNIVTEFLFSPPKFSIPHLHHEFNSMTCLLAKLKNGLELDELELNEVTNLPTILMVCFLNGIENSYESLLESKPFLRQLEDKQAYIKYKEVLRVLRKVKYQPVKTE